MPDYIPCTRCGAKTYIDDIADGKCRSCIAEQRALLRRSTAGASLAFLALRSAPHA